MIARQAVDCSMCAGRSGQRKGALAFYDERTSRASDPRGVRELAAAAAGHPAAPDVGFPAARQEAWLPDGGLFAEEDAAVRDDPLRARRSSNSMPSAVHPRRSLVDDGVCRYVPVGLCGTPGEGGGDAEWATTSKGR